MDVVVGRVVVVLDWLFFMVLFVYFFVGSYFFWIVVIWGCFYFLFCVWFVCLWCDVCVY